MSRNPQNSGHPLNWCRRLASSLVVLCALHARIAAWPPVAVAASWAATRLYAAADQSRTPQSNSLARVVIVNDPSATEAYKPQQKNIHHMVNQGVTRLTGRTEISEAWRTLVAAKDVIGIKVFSAPGGDAGTRPAVVASVIEGLIQANQDRYLGSPAR